MKVVLCNFLVRTLQYFSKISTFFLTLKNEKTALKSCSESAPNFVLVLPTSPKPAQITFLFHKNVSLCDFYIMTLVTFISKNLQISKVFLETIFSHSRSEQFWKQNTKNDLLVLSSYNWFTFNFRQRRSPVLKCPPTLVMEAVL